MTTPTDTRWPQWAAAFLIALRGGSCVRDACRAAGVTSSTPYHLRQRDADFRAAWTAIPAVDGRIARHHGPRRGRGADAVDRFIEELAHSSNVSAAAAVAGIAVSQVYRLKRTDPSFAQRWYAALAEGYDSLEMELLGRLRTGGGGEHPAGEGTAKFDTAAALRCLAAHRDNVAREKGRRTLATETLTIASINAKIDALRRRQEDNRAVVAAARRTKAVGAKAVTAPAAARRRAAKRTTPGA